MSTGRPPGQGALWAMDVVPMTSPKGPVTSLAERRATAEVARLFDLAAREPEALQQLDGCVALLRQVQAAKAALTRLSPDQLRAGLAQRRRILTSDSA